jgi:hypothetical protein
MEIEARTWSCFTADLERRDLRQVWLGRLRTIFLYWNLSSVVQALFP